MFVNALCPAMKQAVSGLGQGHLAHIISCVTSLATRTQNNLA